MYKNIPFEHLRDMIHKELPCFAIMILKCFCKLSIARVKQSESV